MRIDYTAMRIPAGLVIVLAASVTVSPLRAQVTGDARQGLALAREVCYERHALQKQQVLSPRAGAPTFSELAATAWDDDCGSDGCSYDTARI
jgi:hypothetical protein